MALSKEPRFEHGRPERVAVLLVNLGTPDAAEPAAVKRYLRQFLSDARVVEIPALIWRVLLELVILPTRSKRSAEKYRSVWMKDGSPLKVYTERQMKLLRGSLGARPEQILVDYAMRYGSPSIGDALTRLKQEGATRILVLPLYPQYSATTTASAWDAVYAWCETCRDVPELRFVKHYHDHPAYIAALAHRVRTMMGADRRVDVMEAFKQRVVVFSFHGLPKRTLELGDPYHCECLKTGRLLAAALGLGPDAYRVTFQSRFGKAEWLQPYTEPTLIAMAKDGIRAVDVFCPGFPADCLETLEEIAIEGKAAFLKAGGQDFHYIPAFNDDPVWIEALTRIAREHLAGWPIGVKDDGQLQEQKDLARAAGAPH